MQEQPSHPPSDKLRIWEDDLEYGRENADVTLVSAWQGGFRAGADVELEACCKCLIDFDWDEGWSDKLREARRPKPLSLKEQARIALEVCVYGDPIQDDKVRAYNTIRRALDALPD